MIIKHLKTRFAQHL